VTRPKTCIPAAIALFFVAPFVAEFLLGNLTLKLLPALIVLAPMYGGGALIIREAVRGANRGWPGIFVLGAAYTLIEEGFVDQSLFNPDYLQLHLHFLEPAFIPALGIGAWWTLFMFNLHTFWSVAVSIALVEALAPSHAIKPWLGRIGKSVSAALFLSGCAAIASFTFRKDHFVSSHAQFLWTGLLCVVLIVIAFLLPRSHPRFDQGAVPAPWLTGAIALIFGVAVLIIPPKWNWGAVAAMAALDLLFLGMIAVFSRRASWSPLHTFSLAAGGALAYGLHAFFETPAVGGSGAIARIGNTIFLALALALIAIGCKRTSQQISFARGEAAIRVRSPNADRIGAREKPESSPQGSSANFPPRRSPDALLSASARRKRPPVD
jgi:hypothetical protein